MLVAIDLFSGAGGLSWGLEAAGFHSLLAVEQDKWAAQTYKANLSRAEVITRDLEEFSDEEIRSSPRGSHLP
jgi:DNA (cytosine-5)-methyltransferase 1